MSDECEYAESIPAPKCPAAAELAAERAAHLATRQELSMALAERAHARAEVEMHKGLRAETLKANENLRAEVERLTKERDEEAALRETYWLDMETARAEVERLTKELTDLKGDDDAWRRTYESTHAELLEAHAENERLREAMRSYGAHAPDCGDAHGCTCGYSAALAVSEPVETRREQARAFFAGMAQHEGAGSALAGDERRALAERVREACAEADDFNADAADELRCAILALDFDALLEEP